jgi:hypothetical protein
MKYHKEDYSNSKPGVSGRMIVAALVSIVITLGVIGGVLWLMGKL